MRLYTKSNTCHDHIVSIFITSKETQINQEILSKVTRESKKIGRNCKRREICISRAKVKELKTRGNENRDG